MPRYCPLCGKSDSQAQFTGEFCHSCASSRLEAFPPVRITFCQKCGGIIDKARKKKDVKLGEEVIRLLKLKQKNAKFFEDTSEVEYDSSYGRVRQKVLLLRSEGICVDCSRAGSQYFEAIIQLRGKGERVQKMAERLTANLQRTTFIPKIEELKEGIDIYCGSRNEAIAALNAFGLGFLRTEKLAGQRQGRRLYRTTLLVRF